MVSSIDSGWVWMIGVVTFAVGIVCGAAFSFLMSGNGRRRTTELQVKLDQLQQEFDNYRDQVGEHFRKTSELVQTMTDSYRNVYEHLASGSEVLCQDPVSTPRLDFPQRAELDTETDTLASGIELTDSFSDTEPDLGDTSRVPNLDKLHAGPRSTHHTPSA